MQGETSPDLGEGSWVKYPSQARKGDGSSGALWRTLRRPSGPRCGGGHSEKTRKAPLRLGPLDIYCGSLRRRRTGRAAARSAFLAQVDQKTCREEVRTPFVATGLTASIPAAQESRGGEETRRFFVPQEEDGHTAKPAWPLS